MLGLSQQHMISDHTLVEVVQTCEALLTATASLSKLPTTSAPTDFTISPRLGKHD